MNVVQAGVWLRGVWVRKQDIKLQKFESSDLKGLGAGGFGMSVKLKRDPNLDMC